MRLADKLLFCGAICWTLDRMAMIISSNRFTDPCCYNPAVWPFLALALMEYVKLFIVWYRKRRKKASSAEDLPEQEPEKVT